MRAAAAEQRYSPLALLAWGIALALGIGLYQMTSLVQAPTVTRQFFLSLQLPSVDVHDVAIPARGLVPLAIGQAGLAAPRPGGRVPTSPAVRVGLPAPAPSHVATVSPTTLPTAQIVPVSTPARSVPLDRVKPARDEN